MTEQIRLLEGSRFKLPNDDHRTIWRLEKYESDTAILYSYDSITGMFISKQRVLIKILIEKLNFS